MKIGVIDLETTGFLPKGLIVEVGITELDLETGMRKVIYDELVKEDGFGESHRNSWVFQNTSIKFDDVMKAEPLDFDLLQEIMIEYPLTAFNKKFDFGYLRARGFSFTELQCPMVLSTDLCGLKNKKGGKKPPKAQEAYDFLFPNRGYVEAHRGADDSLHEAEIVFELYQRKIFDPNIFILNS